MKTRKVPTLGKVAISLCAGAAVMVVGVQLSGSARADEEARIVSLRRLSEQEYRHSIADIFSPKINVQGRFEPEIRVGGLLAASSTTLSVTPSGFESYTKIADSISAQVVSPEHRSTFVPCTPRRANAPDDKCAAEFITKYGLLAFRRPLTEAELRQRVDLASNIAKTSGDFYAGLRYSLTSVLASPSFLFRTEKAVAKEGGGFTMDGYSRASRLSYLLWGTTPDLQLLQAAGSGELMTDEGLRKSVDRLMSSPRLETGVRGFFSDFLAPDYYGNVNKDTEIYPKWTLEIGEAAKEQALRDVIQVTLNEQGDTRDILTTRKTQLNRQLAAVYKAPYTFKSDWEPYEFAEEDGRSGLITQLSVLANFSHPGRSSPTQRGKAVLDIFLCSPTPPAPADVDFSAINDANNPNLKTVRQRLNAHATGPACKSCHTHMDPIGLSLENFDSTGQFRTVDNGEPIDASATMAGKEFVGAAALGEVLRNDRRFPACVAKKLHAYGVGANSVRVPAAQYKAGLDAFIASNYRLPALIKATVTNPQFFAAPAPPPPPATPVVKADAGKARPAA